LHFFGRFDSKTSNIAHYQSLIADSVAELVRRALTSITVILAGQRKPLLKLRALGLGKRFLVTAIMAIAIFSSVYFASKCVKNNY
jgi:hypothetical protein